MAKNMFYNCTSLSNFIIPSSVTTIENLAFADCSCLTNIIIPSKIKNTILIGIVFFFPTKVLKLYHKL